MSIADWLFDTTDTQRAKFWDGRTGTWSKVASVAYLAVAVVAMVVFLRCAPTETAIALHHFNFWSRIALLVLGAFISVGPPIWFWIEGRAFDNWVNDKYPIRSEQAALRDTYRINTDQATKFWAAVVALYAAVLLKW